MADKVFINGMAAVHKGSSSKGMAFPDVCLCPPSPPAGPVPTPLTNTFKAADLENGASTVFIEGNRVGNMNSYIGRSTGNAVSRPTGGGVITHAVEGAAYPLMGSFNVWIEGHQALRANDLWTANHQPGAKMPANTPPAPLVGPMIAPGGVAPAESERDAREGKDWIRISAVDVQGQPLPFTDCKVQTPKGAVVAARLLGAGRLKVIRISKGNCQVTFPSFDTPKAPKTKPGDKTGPAPKPCAISKADKGYKPGSPLSLATGRAHKIELPVQPSFWLQLNVTARDAATMEDEYVLESEDGSYQVRRNVGKDHVRGAVRRALEFPCIYEGPLYSLTHHPAGAFAPYVVFTGRTFETLLQSSRWLRRSSRTR